MKTMETTERLEKTTPAVDSLTGYLQEISSINRLSPQQEQLLSAQVLAGQAAEKAMACGELAEEKALPLIQQGKAAREQLVAANLRLVVVIAKGYQNRGLSLSDLIQEGNIGLMKAAGKYDATTGNRFSTCAAWWIRQGISRAVAEQGRVIRLPSNVFHRVSRLNRAQRELELQLQRSPSPRELAAYTGLSEKTVRELLGYSAEVTSLELPLGDAENSATLGELAASVSPMEAVENAVAHTELCSVLQLAMDSLSERERLVLTLRYGLDGHSVHTLEAISGQLGLTRERVRQLEVKALRQLRSCGLSPRLAGFIA